MPNIFEQNAQKKARKFDASAIFNEAVATNAPSLRQVVLAHSDMDGLDEAILCHAAATYGLADRTTGELPDYAFPDPEKYGKYPSLWDADNDWVSVVLNGVKKAPNTRLKTMIVDLQQETSRALGYTKGKMKKEAIIKSLTRETTAKTIYVKQKVDRDDILDITDFDYAALLRQTMRIKLDEELARAILYSDGRDTGSDDKISEDAIRPIVKDDELYVIKKEYGADDNIVDQFYGAMEDYNGGGNLTVFMHYKDLAPLMTKRDTMGHRLYRTKADLAAEMGVSRIVTCKYATVGTFVALDLSDYTLGANRGGAPTMFDDFDIDYNQYKYLLETRRCGSLLVPKSAIVLTKTVSPGP